MHSIQLKTSWKVVKTLINVPAHQPDAVYTADVEFVNGQKKLSTFFPDQCTVEQITKSIAYANNNQTGAHQQWGVLGPSAPASNASGYCLAGKGAPFSIRMGVFDNPTKVNTAFPNVK